MKRELICPVCSRKFETNKNAQKYCSPKCRRKANFAANLEKQNVFNCAWCGKEFISERSKKYCCDTCRVNANRPSAKRKPKTEPRYKLSTIAFLSRSLGMSYGQYVSKYQLK